MFQQGKFQDVTFIIKVDQTTVGGGFLGKRTATLALPADAKKL